jgi:GNAT superfamily N-acetyltransferase
VTLSQAEVLPPAEFERVAHLFDAFDYDRCLIGSVLERHQAGLIFCDDTQDPQCAALYHPGDNGYLAGNPESGDLRRIIEEAPGAAGITVSEQELLVPRSTCWIASLTAAFGDRLQRKAYEYFSFTDANTDWIQRWPERVPAGMQVVPMDLELARRAEQDKTLQVATAQTWGSFERFVENGFGFVVVAGSGDLLGAISSFALGEGEAEIDIATHEDHRRQGLATLMGCAFIAHCLEKDLTPSWTANFGNRGSTATARRLGFVQRFVLPCFTIVERSP